MDIHYSEMAKLMLKKHVLPTILESRLDFIDKLIKRANPEGSLRSSQIVAVEVARWNRENIQVVLKEDVDEN